MLYESTKHRTNKSSRHHPQKWRISIRIFLQELLNLGDYFLYDLDNEEENEFFAAVDLGNVNVSDKVYTVTVEKANRSTEVNKHRFVKKTQELQHSPVKLSVKGLFRYPVKCFE